MIELDQAGRIAGSARRVPVPTHLRPWVESTTIVRYPQDFRVASWLIVPDPSAHVIVGMDTGGRVRARVVGPRSRAVRFALDHRRWLVGVRLRPGAISGLGGRLGRAWTDRCAWLGDCVPRGLRGRVDEVAGDTPEETLGRLTTLLTVWSKALREPDWRVSALLRCSESIPEVSGVARAMGVSGRSLREVVGREAGLSPKRVLRIRRVLAAAAGTARTDLRLSRIAVSTGYVDQAHMVRDFLELMGEPPSAYRARRAAMPFRTSGAKGEGRMFGDS